jgi:hypothetical protein
MFELVVTVLFVLLLVGVVRLAFRITWGMAKVAIFAALAVVLPALVGCFLTFSGLFLLLPLGLLSMAFGLVQACV